MRTGATSRGTNFATSISSTRNSHRRAPASLPGGADVIAVSGNSSDRRSSSDSGPHRAGEGTQLPIGMLVLEVVVAGAPHRLALRKLRQRRGETSLPFGEQ